MLNISAIQFSHFKDKLLWFSSLMKLMELKNAMRYILVFILKSFILLESDEMNVAFKKYILTVCSCYILFISMEVNMLNDYKLPCMEFVRICLYLLHHFCPFCWIFTALHRSKCFILQASPPHSIVVWINKILL